MIFLFLVTSQFISAPLQARTCTTSVQCGGQLTMASCSSRSSEGANHNGLPDCKIWAGDPYKCRMTGFCEMESPSIHRCGRRYIKLSDNSLVQENVDEYACCKGDQAITTTNKADCL